MYVLVLSAIDVIVEKSVGGLISGELKGSSTDLQYAGMTSDLLTICPSEFLAAGITLTRSTILTYYCCGLILLFYFF